MSIIQESTRLPCYKCGVLLVEVQNENDAREIFCPECEYGVMEDYFRGRPKPEYESLDREVRQQEEVRQHH